jgi:TrmH family RNA methyltransferase
VNRPTRIVLVRPRNPLNIGACARAMANFGLSDLVVVDPFEPVWRETTSAPGAEKIVLNARLASSWDEAIRDCEIVLGTSSFHQRVMEQATIELPNLNRYLSYFAASSPLAIVFGSERSGLSNEELARCQAVLHIPTRQDAPSMNLGQAVAIILYEGRRVGWETSPPPAPAAPAELEKFIGSLAALGKDIDYPPGFEQAARVGRIRLAFQNAVLPPATVRFLVSFFRKLSKKLE